MASKNTCGECGATLSRVELDSPTSHRCSYPKLTKVQWDALVHFAGVQKYGRMLTRRFDYPPRIDVERRLRAHGLIDDRCYLTTPGQYALKASGREREV